MRSPHTQPIGVMADGSCDGACLPPLQAMACATTPSPQQSSNGYAATCQVHARRAAQDPRRLAGGDRAHRKRPAAESWWRRAARCKRVPTAGRPHLALASPALPCCPGPHPHPALSFTCPHPHSALSFTCPHDHHPRGWPRRLSTPFLLPSHPLPSALSLCRRPATPRRRHTCSSSTRPRSEPFSQSRPTHPAAAASTSPTRRPRRSSPTSSGCSSCAPWTSSTLSSRCAEAISRYAEAPPPALTRLPAVLTACCSDRRRRTDLTTAL